jgi:rubrerythrin
MNQPHWTLDSINWAAFDASKVDPALLAFAKAASVVERNAKHYEDYLTLIFKGDPDFQEAIKQWADEEVQHGIALAKWAEMADKSFHFESSFKKFQKGYRLPVGVTTSVRGSKAGELIARCIVETGTSSFYTAVADATEEPALKQIAKHIAADEFRHYKLFYKTLQRYLESEKIGFLKRLFIVLGRIKETEDDELAYAYFSTTPLTTDYNLKFYAAQILKSYTVYRRQHVERAAAMVFKAIGLQTQSKLFDYASRFSWWMMQRKLKKIALLT